MELNGGHSKLKINYTNTVADNKKQDLKTAMRGGLILRRSFQLAIEYNIWMTRAQLNELTTSTFVLSRCSKRVSTYEVVTYRLLGYQ